MLIQQGSVLVNVKYELGDTSIKLPNSHRVQWKELSIVHLNLPAFRLSDPLNQLLDKVDTNDVKFKSE